MKAGERYRYPGYPSGFSITAVCLPGHPEDDGGLSGVGIHWFGFTGRKGHFFVPCKTVEGFWAIDTFRPAQSGLEDVQRTLNASGAGRTPEPSNQANE